VFLVPVIAESSDVNESFLRRHVIRPNGSGLYETLEKEPLCVRVEEGRVSVSNPPIEVEIAYSETYYDSEYRALRVVNLADFLRLADNVPLSSALNEAPANDLWSHLGASPARDAAALTLMDAETSAHLAKRLEKFEEMMKSTFSAAALARHGPLVQHSIGFFCKHAWELTNDTVHDLTASAAAFCAARHITRNALVCAVEGVIMDRLYTVVMPLLCVMHADHDATLSLASSCRSDSDTFGVPSDMRGCLDEATLVLDGLASHTTPLGKLKCLQSCVAVIARQARVSKSPARPAGDEIQRNIERRKSVDPERPLSLTADELLPMLIAVILRSSVSNLSAHFSYIQFRQDKGSELAYYLTTIRAALEFIRNNVGPRLLFDELSPAEGTPGAGSGSSALSSFAFDLPDTPNRSSSETPLRLSPQLLAQAMKRGLDGVPPLEVKDRRFRLNKYKDCWVGAEFVDWIVQVHKLTREQATLLGRSMVLQGLARHVPEEQDFADDYLFFVWVDRRSPSVESELSEKGASNTVLSQVRLELAEVCGYIYFFCLMFFHFLFQKRRGGWTPSKQLAAGCVFMLFVRFGVLLKVVCKKKWRILFPVLKFTINCL
jgi:hypothetical protein